MPTESADYFLKSKRLAFRRWRADDQALAGKLWGDLQVTRLFSREPFSEQQVEDRLRTEIERNLNCGLQYWPIFQLDDDDFVGCCGLRPYRPAEEIAELGFHL